MLKEPRNENKVRNHSNKFFFCLLLSIPVENFEDHSAPPSPDEKDSGFFMLRKDSERRATLHHILTEDRDKVVANLMEALTQVSDDTDAPPTRPSMCSPASPLIVSILSLSGL